MGINIDLVRRRIDLVNVSLQRLRRFQRFSLAEFGAHPDNFAVAEHHLRRALEAVFDLGRHLIAKKGWGHPQDYRSIITLLAQNGVLPKEFAARIRGMAGYRNRLVHGYLEVSLEEMYRLLQERLGDLEAFCRHVADYLNNAGEF